VSDIQIYRSHSLGLIRARQLAERWAQDARERLDMECVWSAQAEIETIEFRRSGVKGSLVVTADHFKLDAALGFLLQAFRRNIELEIEKNLDQLLS
jgi:putative polyhydroxyalkanoate system protein